MGGLERSKGGFEGVLNFPLLGSISILVFSFVFKALPYFGGVGES